MIFPKPTGTLSETSWDLQNIHWIDEAISSRIETSYEIYRDFTERQFNKLKSNEEELNRIFIDIYGLQDELTPDVEDKDVTIYRNFDSKAIPESMKSSRYALTKHDV